jgi:hypothetical protein
MASIERYIHPNAFQAIEGSCQMAEGLWGMGLLTALREHHPITPEAIQMQHPHNITSAGVAIQKPYSEEPFAKFGDATWLVVTGPCAGFILTPKRHGTLRPLRHVPIDNDSTENFFRMRQLKHELLREHLLIEGPGWYLSAIIELLRKNIPIQPDANTIWQNSLAFHNWEIPMINQILCGTITVGDLQGR